MTHTDTHTQRERERGCVMRETVNDGDRTNQLHAVDDFFNRHCEVQFVYSDATRVRASLCVDG